MRAILNNTRGAITPLALIAAFYLTVTSFYLLFLLHKWHRNVEMQYQLDRCIAEKAQKLRNRFQAIEDANLRMRWARMIAKATTPFPPATAAARAWNATEFALQMVRVSTHLVEQGLWSARQGCNGEGSGIFIYPSIPYLPSAADDVGPQPLKFNGQKAISIHLARGSRSSSAALYWAPNQTTAAAIDRAIPQNLKDLLENPIVKSFYKSIGPLPFDTKKWRSAWIPKF